MRLTVLVLLLSALPASAWEDFPVVKTLDDVKALPHDAGAVSVMAGPAHAREVLEALAERGNIHSLHILLQRFAAHAEPLKHMDRLYELSIMTNANSRELFTIIGELKDLKSFHLRMH